MFTSSASLELEVFHALTEVVNRRRPPPRELPPRVSAFTGRTAELEELDGLLRIDRAPFAVVISAVSGTAGVGKTALAVYWAHAISDLFPDGQLYVDLRGYDPGRPMPAREALAMFLRALGVDGASIPHDTDERASQYRTLLAGRRMLILLDNAASTEQVRLLLPGGASCLVLVTSRDSLTGLVARHGAHRIDLDALPLDDAVALLRRLIGVRLDSEPDAAVMLAVQCARLPLALRVAAELAVTRSDTPLTELNAELVDEQRRLELLDAGSDTRTSIRAVFSWSYNRLPDEAARAFALLGLHPGPDIDAAAAAALFDVTRECSQHLLDTLMRAHLTHRTAPGRYGMHDLLRTYARSLVARDLAAEQDHATGRLLDYYLGSATLANRYLAPDDTEMDGLVQDIHVAIAPLSNTEEALAWMEDEHRNLVACVELASHRQARDVVHLSVALHAFLRTRGYWDQAAFVHQAALAAARQAGYLHGQACTLHDLGVVLYLTDDYRGAVGALDEALVIFRILADTTGVASALHRLGIARVALGDYPSAAQALDEAVAISRAAGNKLGAANALNEIGALSYLTGDYPSAAVALDEALAIYRELGDTLGQANALHDLGVLRYLTDDYIAAAEPLEEALTLYRDLGDRRGQANVLNEVGIVRYLTGDYTNALAPLGEALAYYRDLGDRLGQANALKDLGVVHWMSEQADEALSLLETALAIYRDLGHRLGQANALKELGVVRNVRGDNNGAWDALDEALELSRELDDRLSIAETLTRMGALMLAANHSRGALAHYTEALSLAREVHSALEEARALEGIGRCLLKGPRTDDGRAHLRQSQLIYERLCVPQASVVASVLANSIAGEEHD